jgi:hypothetical protein
MTMKREQKKREWTSPVHVCVSEWPDWVPILEEDEFAGCVDAIDVNLLVREWVLAVFGDPTAQRTVAAELSETLLWDPEGAVGAWNMAMRKLGYVVKADDWR